MLVRYYLYSNITMILVMVMLGYFLVFIGAVELQANPDIEPPVSLCHTPGCSCLSLPGTGLLAVKCYCHHQQVLKIGLHSRVTDSSEPPDSTGSLIVDNCHHVELYSRLLNHMKSIQNITIKNTHTVVIHPKLYEAKGAVPVSGSVHNVELTNIHKLQVRRYSFKDLEVTGRLYLGEV